MHLFSFIFKAKITWLGSRLFDEYWLYIVKRKGSILLLKSSFYHRIVTTHFIPKPTSCIIPIIYGCILLTLLTPWSHICKRNAFWLAFHGVSVQYFKYVLWCLTFQTHHTRRIKSNGDRTLYSRCISNFQIITLLYKNPNHVNGYNMSNKFL